MLNEFEEWRKRRVAVLETVDEEGGRAVNAETKWQLMRPGRANLESTLDPVSVEMEGWGRIDECGDLGGTDLYTTA